MQNKMLETLETKIDHVNEHVVNVNAKLKTTLEEARKSDKICMVRLLVFIATIFSFNSCSLKYNLKAVLSHSTSMLVYYCTFFN